MSLFRASIPGGLRLLAVGLLFFCHPGQADEDTHTFLSQAFVSGIPDPAVLWLTGERAEMAAAILGHKPPSLRQRYWRKGHRTAWILEAIGKEKSITAGFIIDEGKLVDTRVLAYRESRGWEIGHAFFTDQFKGLRLADDTNLSGHIDNITGATLSVNAMKRMARLALYLDGALADVTP